MNFSEIFAAEKAKLNPEQRAAVEKIFGPVLVIAGPGTGKTQVLAMRIAEILQKTDTDPAQILALTFTEAGVLAMRNRLRKIIGPAAHAVRLSTFHGFCAEILRRFPEKFLFAKTLETADDLVKIQLLKEILADKKYRFLTPFSSPNRFLKAILGVISRLKRENISPADFEKIAQNEKKNFDEMPESEKKNKKTGKMLGKWVKKRRKIEKFLELADIFQKYENALKKRGFMDFDDQILFVLSALETDDDFLASLREEFLFFLSDEFQDSNGAQMRILELLAGDDPTPNLFVVGDDDQSIYRFQGANLENIFHFLRKFPAAEKITLVKNYRSTDEILRAARSLIENNSERLPFEKNISSAFQKFGQKPVLAIFETPEAEHFFLLEKIRELLKKGAPPEEIAILTRTNATAQKMAAYLEKNGVPAIFGARGNALDDPIVRLLVDLFRLVDAPSKILSEIPRAVDTRVNSLFFRVLHAPFFGLSAAEIWENWKKIKAEKSTFLKSEHPKIAEISQKIEKWAGEATRKNAAEMAEKIFFESGAIDFVCCGKRHLDSLSHLNSLFSEMKNLVGSHPDFSLGDFLNNLELREEFDLGIADAPLKKRKNAISILTAHGAKGLEFETIFLVDAANGVWGDRRKNDDIALPDGLFEMKFDKNHENQEERRLFFVAMTRAKQNLFLTVSTRGSAKPRVVSRFLDEIAPEFFQKISTEQTEKKIFEHFRAEILPEKKPEKALENFLLPIFSAENFAISPTAFENFRECPRKFLYENVLRIPHLKSRSAALGTAIHRALEIFFVEKMAGKTLKMPEILAIFVAALKKEMLSKDDFSAAEIEGRELLQKYFAFYGDAFPPVVATERDFRGDRVFCGDVPITGKIDKIEKIDKTTVRIVDYKTSTHKSENEIRGNRPSDAQNVRAGALFRQLLFYFLLTRNSKKFPFSATHFCLDFVRPDDNEKFVRREFCLSDADAADLEDEIQKMFSALKNFTFLKKSFECAATKNGEKCEYCEMFFGGKII